ncbi:MAG: PhnD/SsuA/transferrin family substrate-binding protein [Pirellulaceae bacterium]|nr:PhnD/SsuA/transferrin family substrate-binding protein [Pirellulaceae bacterium]
MSADVSSPPRRKVSLKNVLLVAIPCGIVVLGVFGWLAYDAERAVTRVDFLDSVKNALQSPTSLAQGLADADQDLVADPPADADKLLDPDILEFELLGRDLALEQRNWADFVQHLEDVTDKEVRLVLRTEESFSSPNNPVPPALRQAHDLRAGKIHLACLNTGAVTLGVNEGGGVPFCVMADDDGQFGYEVEIIVPAASRVQKPADLKGAEKVLFASLYSHSGFKASLVLLWSEFGLRPERDYGSAFVAGQEQAIKDIAAGKADAAPVASDLLRRMIGRGEVKADAIRSIYQSQKFPPACFVYAHQLKPELADKVKEAFLKFPWEGTSLAAAYAPANQTKFVPVSYQKDWQVVREFEERVDKLLETSRAK